MSKNKGGINLNKTNAEGHNSLFTPKDEIGSNVKTLKKVNLPDSNKSNKSLTPAPEGTISNKNHPSGKKKHPNSADKLNTPQEPTMKDNKKKGSTAPISDERRPRKKKKTSKLEQATLIKSTFAVNTDYDKKKESITSEAVKGNKPSKQQLSSSNQTHLASTGVLKKKETTNLKSEKTQLKKNKESYQIAANQRFEENLKYSEELPTGLIENREPAKSTKFLKGNFRSAATDDAVDKQGVAKKTTKRRVRARDSKEANDSQGNNSSVSNTSLTLQGSNNLKDEEVLSPASSPDDSINIFRDVRIGFKIEEATARSYISMGRYGAGAIISDKLLTRAETEESILYLDSSLNKQYILSEYVAVLYSNRHSYYLKVATNIALLDLFFCYRGWRHFKCLPVRGQRTWTNASTVLRVNRTLRDLKVRVARNVYGNFGSSAVSTAIFAEQYNMLWYRQWHMDWAAAKHKRINFSAKSKNVCIMDLNSTALGKISGSNRLAKPGKKKKVYKKNTFTIGFTLGSTKWMLAASQTSELLGVFKLKTGQLIQILLSTPVEKRKVQKKVSAQKKLQDKLAKADKKKKSS